MDFYSTLNSLAPKISYLSRDLNDQTNDIIVFPQTEEPVFILGNKYSSLYELEDIQLDVRSKLWMTYRRNFAPIGDTNFTSDSGWGCMLRCGQMVLARAFCILYLGRNWRWTYSNYESLQKLLSEQENKQELEKYFSYRNILKLFADLKTAPYSIHQIALMGACEGKEVGQWFGPNTIAQVLRKLSTFDKINNIHIYVALDNVVFLDDIKKSCTSISLESIKTNKNANNSNEEEILCREFPSQSNKKWKPLLLFIPLRLGLSVINPVYFRSLKATFTFPQTLGILGGRPNHALYFIGCCGDDLIYLDPHTTQPAVSLAQDLKEIKKNLEEVKIDELSDDSDGFLTDDISYHCDKPYRMSISLLDPSLSLCFFCKTEEEFDQWTNFAFGKLIHNEEQPLFEIMKKRPNDWPLNDDIEFCSTNQLDGSSNGFPQHNYNTDKGNLQEIFSALDEEFEIIE